MANNPIENAKGFLSSEYALTVQRLMSDSLATMAGGDDLAANIEMAEIEKSLKQQAAFQTNIIERKSKVKTDDLARLLSNLQGLDTGMGLLSDKDNNSIRGYLSMLITKLEEEMEKEKAVVEKESNKKIETEKQKYQEKLLAQAAANEKELRDFVTHGRDRLSVLDAFFETALLSAPIFTSLEAPSTYQGFPLLNHVCVGEKKIHIPVRGREDIEFNVPEIIPFYTTNALTISYKHGQRHAANRVLDQIFIRSLCCLSTDHVSISFLAPGNKGDLFVNYLDLSELAKRIYNGHVLTTFEEIMPFLDAVIEENKQVFQTKSLGSRIDLYNETHQEKISYRIIFLDATSIELPPPMLDRLIQLADDVCYSGIHLVIVTEDSAVQSPRFERLLSRTYSYSIPDDLKQPEGLIPEVLKRTKDKVNSQYGQVQGFNFEDYYKTIEIWKKKEGVEYSNYTRASIGVVNSRNFEIVYNEEGVKGPASAHTIMLGGTGSGKTTFLHAFIMGLALKYSPNEVRFILVDLKGTGFQDYALHKFPHADIVAYSGSAELGVHTLELAIKKMEERGKLFNDRHVDNLREFREHYPDEALPRYFVIIDEYQSMFKDSEYRKRAKDYIDIITEKARTYGINLLLASQKLPLTRESLNNFTTSIVLKCEKADSARVLLGPGNKYTPDVPNLLYESIIMSGGRTVKSKFYYLKPEKRKEYLELIRGKAEADERIKIPRLLVFDGTAKAYLSNNFAYSQLKPQPQLRVVKFSPGEKVLIDGEDLMKTLIRMKGNNIYVTGGDLQPSVRTLHGCLKSMLPQFEQHSAEGAVFNLFNFVDPMEEFKSKLDESLKAVADTYPGSICGDDSNLHEILQEALQSIKVRKENGKSYYPPQFIVMFQMERSKVLSPMTTVLSSGKLEEHVSDELKMLMVLLKEGPEFGIHCLLHTYSIDGLFDLCMGKADQVYSHVKHRILLQMNKDESSLLMKCRNASELTDPQLDEVSRINRAIYFDTNTPNIKNTIIKPYEFEITPQEENRSNK
jgi:hypothetical protein